MLIILGNYVLPTLYLLMKLGGANCQDICTMVMLPTDQSQLGWALHGPIGAWGRFFIFSSKIAVLGPFWGHFNGNMPSIRYVRKMFPLKVYPRFLSIFGAYARIF